MNKIKSRKEKRFSVLLTAVMILIMIITVYPVWYSLINSLNSAQDIAKNGYAMLLPGEFSLESWQSVLKNPEIFRAFGITFTRTIIVTVIQTLFTSMFAYGFSRDNLVGKKFYTVLGFISMYLNGGVIAYFILFNAMHIYNSYWVYILPALFGGFYNVIIFNTNFKAIPESLFESAKIDGANEWIIFWRIVMPQVKPAWLTVTIFAVQALWNGTSGSNYIYSEKLKALPYAMNQIVNGGLARQGAAAAATLVMMVVPIVIFLFAQNNIVETMASSGIKE